MHSRPSFLTLDALLGMVLFGMFMVAVALVLLVGQKGVQTSGEIYRGVNLAQESLEVVRSIRDQDFSLLTVGQHGYQLGSAGKWELTGVERITEDGYRIVLDIAEITQGHLRVASTVTKDDETRPVNLSLETEFTDWKSIQEVPDWSTVSLEGYYVDDGTPLFNDIAVIGDIVFVSSETSDGGDGLYLFDISDPSSPERLSSSYSLGTTGYGLEVSGSHLFVLTGDQSGELRVYDVTDTASFSDTQLVYTEDIPGSSIARTLEVVGDTLYVISLEDATESELFSYDISTPSSLISLDDFQEEGSLRAAVAHGGYLFLANSAPALDLRIVDIFDPSDLSSPIGEGYDIPWSTDGLSVAKTSQGILLGLLSSAFADDIALLDISESPIPSPPPGPWFHELGGDARSIAVDTTERYAFVASDFSEKELQVLDVSQMAQDLPAEVAYYDTETGEGRAVEYLSSANLVLLATNTALIILSSSP